jgi:predicted molibdopterin-dependent oxidoreductase YjgC
VEVDGSRRLLPSCATPAAEGQVVATANDRVERHRSSLMALYLTDHPETADGSRGRDELLDMAERWDAPRDWGRMEPQRAARPDDRNPYIDFDASACIVCGRCTRYCDEVEAVSAITLAGRGSRTTIATADSLSLLDTTCEMCGGCIDTCPTGAMSEKAPLQLVDLALESLPKVRTTCNFCGVGCQIDLNVDSDGNDGRGRVVRVTSPEPGTTTNDGNMCVKGRFAYDFIDHPDRLTTPLVRGDDGELHEASWDEALEVAARGLERVAEAHGPDSLGFVSSSRCTVEENYLVQKLARVVFHTNNVHQCAAT